jgi:hypothetical protein
MRELLESVVTIGNCVGTAGPDDTRVGCFCDAATRNRPINDPDFTNWKDTSGGRAWELENWSGSWHLSFLSQTQSDSRNCTAIYCAKQLMHKVVNETVLRNDCLRCFIHIFIATCFGLSNGSPTHTKN